MEIEDCGQVNKFETLSKECTLYLTAVRYGTTAWFSGPSSMEKSDIIKRLNDFSGITAARIYSVKVPMNSIGAE